MKQTKIGQNNKQKKDKHGKIFLNVINILMVLVCCFPHTAEHLYGIYFKLFILGSPIP